MCVCDVSLSCLGDWIKLTFKQKSLFCVCVYVFITLIIIIRYSCRGCSWRRPAKADDVATARRVAIMSRTVWRSFNDRRLLQVRSYVEHNVSRECYPFFITLVFEIAVLLPRRRQSVCVACVWRRSRPFLHWSSQSSLCLRRGHQLNSVKTDMK